LSSAVIAARDRPHERPDGGAQRRVAAGQGVAQLERYALRAEAFGARDAIGVEDERGASSGDDLGNAGADRGGRRRERVAAAIVSAGTASTDTSPTSARSQVASFAVRNEPGASEQRPGAARGQDREIAPQPLQRRDVEMIPVQVRDEQCGSPRSRPVAAAGLAAQMADPAAAGR
jgi:hypothetical protein